LNAPRFRQQAGVIALLTMLFGAWLLWLDKGTVSLYVPSEHARFEIRELPVPIQAPVDGQIVLADMRLGRLVAQGDAILKLDTRAFAAKREELAVALRTGETSLEALRAQLAAERDVRDAMALMAKQTSTIAAARVSLDQKTLAIKEKESEIVGRLRDASIASALDALHTAAAMETQRAQVAATSAQAALDTSASKMNLRDRDAHLASVRVAIAQAEAETAKVQAQLDALAYEIERRTIRAPVAGTLADVMPISIGMTVTSQQRLGTILPPGNVRVVAFFSPQESLGRLRPGQSATLRVDNFPWTQFGTVGALIDQIGQEPRDGGVRVELDISRPNVAIPLEHGMTTGCEVEVERTTPLHVLLRTVGHWFVATSSRTTTDLPEPQAQSSRATPVSGLP
jgi:membrane fusion protein (multidrug efflux system)